jgi:hypothetical protein
LITLSSCLDAIGFGLGMKLIPDLLHLLDLI